MCAPRALSRDQGGPGYHLVYRNRDEDFDHHTSFDTLLEMRHFKNVFRDTIEVVEESAS